MNDQKKFADQIDRYIDGMLDEDEKLSLENEMSLDPAFEEEVRKQILMIRGIKRYGRAALAEKIAGWEEEIQKEDGHRILPAKRIQVWYYAAAVVAFLIVISASLYFINWSGTNDSLYARYYSPYEFSGIQTRGTESSIKTYNDIMSNYESGNYEQALNLIHTLSPEANTPELLFLSGNAYQASGRIKEAMDIYLQLADKESVFKSGAQWYLSLCFLALDQKYEAAEVLKDLSGTASSYASRAESLLSKIAEQENKDFDK